MTKRITAPTGWVTALVAWIALLGTPSLVAQPGPPDLRRSGPFYRALSQAFEESYIVPVGGFGNIQKLVFEANIAPHLAFASDGLAVTATPKTLLRMYNLSSLPIRTPTFNPQIRLYYWGRLPRSRQWRTAISLAFAHHSNGQAGPFFSGDSVTLNTTDGSFSTDYLEATAHVIGASPRTGSTGWLSIGVRKHVAGLTEDAELRAAGSRYGRHRLLASTKGLIPVALFGFAPRLDIEYLIDGQPGRMRWIFAPSVSTVLRLRSPIGVFVGGYFGQDYYNIWYGQTLRIVRFGLTLNSITSFVCPAAAAC